MRIKWCSINQSINFIDLNSSYHTWKAGVSLSLHTISSSKDSNGRFHNVYTPIGELLHSLKYELDYSCIDPLTDAIVYATNLWWATKYKDIDVILPAPFSKLRKLQPVYELAKLVGQKLSISVDCDFITKIKQTEELKGVEDPELRRKMLSGCFGIRDREIYRGKNILVLDDLFRSGSTLNEVCSVLYEEANAKNVYVMTLTKTRVNK